MRKSLVSSPYAMLKTNAQALFYECQYSFSLLFYHVKTIIEVIMKHVKVDFFYLDGGSKIVKG